jgi:hypothetical protein
MSGDKSFDKEPACRIDRAADEKIDIRVEMKIALRQRTDDPDLGPMLASVFKNALNANRRS